MLPPETYASRDELTRALQDFVETQRDISRKGFTNQKFEVDGVTGVQVRYISFESHTVYSYYFGKSGRLWRIEIDLDGADTPLPATLDQMVRQVKVK